METKDIAEQLHAKRAFAVCIFLLGILCFAWSSRTILDVKDFAKIIPQNLPLGVGTSSDVSASDALFFALVTLVIFVSSLVALGISLTIVIQISVRLHRISKYEKIDLKQPKLSVDDE